MLNDEGPLLGAPHLRILTYFEISYGDGKQLLRILLESSAAQALVRYVCGASGC